VPETLEWGQPVEGGTLSCSLDKNKVRWDQPVHVTVVTKNVGSRALVIHAGEPWATYEFQLWDPQGEVPRTRFAKRIEGDRREASGITLEVPPGETIVAELPVSRLFDLSERGKYTLEAARTVYGQGVNRLVRLVSNRVSFEIVEE
jgi:hypothetical protein